jgi:phosphoribosylanthranilate isomerase
MSQTKLKICGITTLADARYCAGAGADYLGFIQYDQSPRYIPPGEANEIIEWLYGPESVGVFVNERADTINQIVEQTGFHVAQIHGDMSPEEIATITCKSIRALAIKPETSTDDLRREMESYAESVDYFLLDTAKAGLYGGTGETFDWNVARELTDAFPIFIAGGLEAGNIGEVIRTLAPYAIDLSSSVESSPGVKDFDKLADLFEASEEFRVQEEE